MLTPDGHTHSGMDEWMKVPKLYTPRHTWCARDITGMVVQGQLLEPSICLCDPFIRQKPNNIMLRQQIFFNIYEPKLSIYDITPAKDLFIV